MDSLMQSESETFSIIKDFFAMIKTQYEAYISKIRTDML